MTLAKLNKKNVGHVTLSIKFSAINYFFFYSKKVKLVGIHYDSLTETTHTSYPTFIVVLTKHEKHMTYAILL